MTKRIVLRAVARRDVEAAVDHYQHEAGETVALGFVDAFERACSFIGDQPGAGSPLYAHELDLAGVRHWRVGSFPFLIFYIERPDHIDVWRILHGRRDIPASMRAEGES